jgi:hypothetical protein
VEEEPRSDWQQRYENASPPRPLLWCGAHRRLIRAIGAVVLLLTVVLLVVAVVEGGSLVPPVFAVLTWGIQLVLWGFLYPRQADRWLTRHASSA